MSERPARWSHQTEALEFALDKPGAMLAMEMGTGKSLRDDTPLPTPDGWVNIGDVRPGQTLFDERGKPCTVKAVYPQGEKPVLRVTFDDGTEVLADPEHLWVTLTHSDRAKIHKGTRSKEHLVSKLIPLTTGEIQNSLTHERGKLRESMHSIPLAGPLETPEAELPIDPYILGLWLGDGTARAAGITCHEDDEKHHREAAAAAGENWRIAYRKDNTLWCTLAGVPADGRPRFIKRLGQLCLVQNKHIPQAYMRASAAQRLRLLQGMMDSDGYIDPRNGTAEYISTLEHLARGFLELAISLGQKATIQSGDATLDGRKTSTKWRVLFTPRMNPASLPRKAQAAEGFIAARTEPALARTEQRYIRSITDAGTASTTCITVDSPSGLFLAGHQMVPTHNTRVAIDLIAERDHRRVLVLCPLSIVDHVWPGQVELHQQSPIMVVALGSKLNGVRAKMEAAQKAMRRVRDHTVLMLIVNYESAWRQPLGDWLMKQPWDLVILDESQRLKTPRGRASLWVSRLSDRVGQRLALTGTPMPNTPLDIFGQFRALDKSVYGNSYHQFERHYAEIEQIEVPRRPRNPRSGRIGPVQMQRVPKFKEMRNQDELNEKFYSIAFHVTAQDALDLPETSRENIEFSLSKEGQRIYNELRAEFESEVREGLVTDATNALGKLLRLQQVTSGFAVTQEGEVQICTAKERALSDKLQGIGKEEPAVVFARFRHDLDTIHRVAESLGRPHYEISGPIKQLPEWKQNGGILAVQIQAGGLGLDLTEARYCIYYSLGYSLGDYQQSMARVHRPGQTRKVQYTHLTAAGSVDNDIMRALEKKSNVIEYILETILRERESRE